VDFLQQLRVFVAVAENRSFTRAAEALRATRPTVTNAVNELEESIGARLLHRTTRQTSLTSEGRLFYDRSVAILNEVGQARNLFGGVGDAPKGRLRVDIPVAIAKPLIIPNLPDFQAKYPDIDLILGVSDQPVDLIAEGVDCVLRIGDLPVSSLVGRVLAKMAMLICASPVYLDRFGIPETVEDLRGHLAVNYFSGRGHIAIPWRLPRGTDECELRLETGILVNDTEAFIACALAGMGLIQVPGCVVKDYLNSGELVRVLPKLRPVHRPLSIMFPAREHLAPQVRVFIDWAKSIVADVDSPWLSPP
jgi:LysR family transcriptional regulator for bpeEF and oprC